MMIGLYAEALNFKNKVESDQARVRDMMAGLYVEVHDFEKRGESDQATYLRRLWCRVGLFSHYSRAVAIVCTFCRMKGMFGHYAEVLNFKKRVELDQARMRDM